MRKHRQGELVCVSWRSRLVRKALPPASGRPACRGPVFLPLRAGYGRPGFGLHSGEFGYNNAYASAVGGVVLRF
jgi:hypothetical protein